VDCFILQGLEQADLKPAPEADRLTWLRRVSLDLTGLPPTPEQVEGFLADRDPAAWDRVVERLLASPQYGERWAQHWLDVVRYADTHGFEVNTERPNAWPYRDYVIQAFNQDLPYNRFIQDQLAGDAFGADAATGFLVTAAALLPGQIGQDDASKRLARQESLNEIVTGLGEAFLGLSVGCARCHDHKFDPIPQRDYYAIQAFFAGVEYGDRPIRSPESEARRRAGEAWQPRLAELEAALARFEPLAQVSDSTRREPQARLNEELFEAREARFVRFTIHEANRHPTLGVIEPCLDEVEIFTADSTPRNVALAQAGTRVTASGSRISDLHRLEHLNDGRYGNGRSWMSDEAGRGWVSFELPEPMRIGKIVWSRDREGEFSDRLATAYTLEVGLSLNSLQRVAYLPPLRPAVHPRRTTDRFAPVTTRRIRFSILASTSLEPCLDELEIFTAGVSPQNVALASEGARVTASSTLPESPLHRLEHLNDGRYGNAYSWISQEPGRGWVEVELAREELIERVVWSRDREGKFSDRLPTDYRLEVMDPSGAWRSVASSKDRRTYSPDDKTLVRFSTTGLPPEEQQEAVRLEQERKSLADQIASLTSVPQVFAGSFVQPEVTRLLRRGDPEQPGELITPAVLSVLGSLKLPAESAEQERRLALAAWITGPNHPLTARVLVNRIWQGHFGLGLVETANDFGLNGARPSHPELLDWLAGEFTRSGGSIKQLHRLIVSSATYRQSNRVDPAAQAADANCRLLWRFPSRRLEAESLRDSMLAVSGRLDFKRGGPGFNLFKSRGGLDGFPPIESFSSGDGLRRLIYAHKVRMERDIVFGAFDCPDAGQSLSRRRQSTTPIQALNLFNSRFTVEEAAAWAARVQTELGPAAEPADWIQRAYQLAYGRRAEPEELQQLEPVVRAHGLPTLCRALFNSSEFLVLP